MTVQRPLQQYLCHMHHFDLYEKKIPVWELKIIFNSQVENNFRNIFGEIMGATVGTDCLFCFVYAVHILHKGDLKHSVHGSVRSMTE